MELTLEERIAAPPAIVFDVFSDLYNAPEHLSAVKAVEVIGRGPVGKGTRFRETREVMKGKEVTQELEFTEFDPPRTSTIEADAAGLRFITVYTFKADAGATDVKMHTTTKPTSAKGRVLGPALGWLFKRQMRKTMAEDHRELKAVCEQRAAEAQAS